MKKDRCPILEMFRELAVKKYIVTFTRTQKSRTCRPWQYTLEKKREIYYYYYYFTPPNEEDEEEQATLRRGAEEEEGEEEGGERRARRGNGAVEAWTEQVVDREWWCIVRMWLSRMSCRNGMGQIGGSFQRCA